MSEPLQGVRYTQVSAGDLHSVLLRSDGQVVAFGCNRHGQCAVGTFDSDLALTRRVFVEVSAGMQHTVLLRNDGSAVACGRNLDGRCTIPAPMTYLRADLYRSISAGGFHTMLLDHSGGLHFAGNDADGQCHPPRAEFGFRNVVAISAGHRHSACIFDDGSAIAWGNNQDGQCDIPALEEELTYLQVQCDAFCTVLLRSDGVLLFIGSSRAALFRHPFVSPVAVDYASSRLIPDTGGT